ncbi:type II secretion system protein N [Acinetobacter lanii]|uniref:PDZ domain-containing protein n=1 Tax=Acinetobacter lanii TaxID=2715163 RepID=A0A6G8S7I1_9GAMM|nr:type II secretion system protein N [Acinetobacter lanii]QIO10051.1 PDZ domain-containing protein [Acinetobacter lanii]
MQGLQRVKDQVQSLAQGKADRIAPIVLAVLILMLCWTLAALFWWIMAPPQAIQPEQVSLGSQQPSVPNISNFALFQEVGSTAQAAESNVVLQLQGVVVASPSYNSSAVIKVNDVADRYLVGETLDNTGYQLAEVYWDKVILRQNNGEQKVLEFSGLENLYQPLGPDAAQNSNASTSNSAGSNGTSNAQANTANTNSTTGMNPTQRALGQAIDQIQENREQYLKNMGVNASGGQGYEITDQTPAALKNKLGLKSGDRILSLNGQTVGQGQTEAQLLEQAKREGKVRIEVKRGDQVMTFQQDL